LSPAIAWPRTGSRLLMINLPRHQQLTVFGFPRSVSLTQQNSSTTGPRNLLLSRWRRNRNFEPLVLVAKEPVSVAEREFKRTTPVRPLRQFPGLSLIRFASIAVRNRLVWGFSSPSFLAFEAHALGQGARQGVKSFRPQERHKMIIGEKAFQGVGHKQ
jgi:hypothetical protein